jgi:Cof subfamily protein (haloacid dehalogenase superfamily)
VERISVLFSDVDRTILTHDHTLPDSVADALSGLGNHGIRLVLASARSPAAMRPVAGRLGATSLAIAFNGAWIGDLRTMEAVHRDTLDPGLAAEIVAAALGLGLEPLWFDPDAVQVVRRSALVDHETAVTGEPVREVGAADRLRGRPGKILCVNPDPGDPGPFAAMKARFGAAAAVSASHARLLEIVAPTAGKAAAARRVAERLGTPASACAAAGDAENDVAMLRWAGTAVTVANALPEIRALARFVGPSCDDGGMAACAAWLAERRVPPDR